MAIKQEANRLKMKYQTTDPYLHEHGHPGNKAAYGRKRPVLQGLFPGFFSVQADRDQQ